MKKDKFIIFPFDMSQVISDYADRYLNGLCDHETLDDYCAQVAADLHIPEAAQWTRDEIHRQEQLMNRRAA